MAAIAQPFCERIIDRYAVYERIAAGGMAVVHFGRLLGQAGFSRTVAIKRLHPQFASDPDFVGMFLDEARLAVRVQHPNVVAPLDVVVADGELLVVMDYISGETLSALLRGASPADAVPPPIIGSVLVDVLYGLHAAHEAKAEDGAPLNIVHRDVSPQNVIVGVDGAARVLDFGVAKAAMRSQVTKNGEIKGKISYMAPEQLRSQSIDRRADVFAAGILLWEALTGRRLFRGEDLGQSVQLVLHGEIPAPSSINGAIGTKLDAVALKALERDPERRFATARDFAVALESATPIASPGEVADWVRALGGNQLAQRIQRVAAIESHSSSRVKVSGRSPLHTPLGLQAVSLTELPSTAETGLSLLSDVALRDEAPTVRPQAAPVSELSALPSTPKPSRAFRLLWIGAALLGVLGITAAFAWSGRQPSGASSSGATAVPSPTPPVKNGASVLGALPEPASTSRAAGALPPPSAASAESSPPAAPKRATAPAAARSARSPAGTSAPARKSAAPVHAASTSCNPPYVLDARGIRRVKPECM